MFKAYRRSAYATGFTLIELLVVIGIIAMLIGIIVPGMRGLKMRADALSQKSLFRGIEIGVELFRNEYDEYPDSDVVTVTAAGSKKVIGAQHLTEALVGRDERGFDPKTKWHEAGEPSDLYDSDETTDEGKASLARREEPYLELKKTAANLLEQIYLPAVVSASDILANDPPVAGMTGTIRAPFLTDVFDRDTGLDDPRKSGTPILYFKADPSSKHYKAVPTDSDDTGDWIYDWQDNADLFELPPLRETDKYPEHLYYKGDYIDGSRSGTELDGKIAFYEAITNKKASFDKPHNPNTFILISAGWDGVFGTKDDVTNFD